MAENLHEGKGSIPDAPCCVVPTIMPSSVKEGVKLTNNTTVSAAILYVN